MASPASDTHPSAVSLGAPGDSPRASGSVEPDGWIDELVARVGPRPPGSKVAAAARENGELAVRYDPVATSSATARRQRGRVFAMILRLSPTLDIFEAMLFGERLPLSRLDPYWVEKYGLREGREVAGGG